MDREVVKTIEERALEKEQEREDWVGTTTVVCALLAALITLGGHRAHTEEVKNQAQAADQWAFYEAKHLRAHMYLMEAEKALADKQEDLAIRFLEVAVYEQCGKPPSDECKSGSPFKNSSVSDLLGKIDNTRRPISTLKQPSAIMINQKAADLDKEVQLSQRVALWYDWGEVFFEISIMLCGIALMAKKNYMWKLSFLFAITGAILGVSGLLLFRGWLH